MDQVIIPPDDEWVTYIARMWLLGSRISEEITGEEMDGSLDDLDRLQAVIDSAQVSTEKAQELQSLGIVLGKVFVNESPDFDWWVVEDEYGKDACIRYKETTLLMFPQTVISKRLEDGEVVRVGELYLGIKEHLRKLAVEHYGAK